MYCIVSALHSLREIGELHQDVKPQNILYNSHTGNFYICDFILSKSMNGSEDEGGLGYFTSYYTPPESYIQPYF